MKKREPPQLTGDDPQDTIDQVCLFSKDGSGHCGHWWDTEPCCWCGSDGGDKISVRPAVQRFALLMEYTLRRNDERKGYYDGQRLGFSMEYLMVKLLEEVGELAFEVQRRNVGSCQHEAADVANIAMMIADNIRCVELIG
jgi:NTP pyrophosphatase (non-canonical NTP hydrolase)